MFSFQRRTMQLNWPALLHLDLNTIIQTVDLNALHSQLESLTFADIGEADLAYFTDANFLHLFRLAQLVLEYTLFAWKASTVSANLRDKKYATLKQHVTKLKEKLEAEKADNKHLRKELKYCKQLVAALEGTSAQKQPIVAPVVQPLGGSVGRHAPRGHLAHHDVHATAAPSQLQPHVPIPTQPTRVEEVKEQQFDPLAQAREQAAREQEKAQLVEQLRQQAALDAKHTATKMQEEIDAQNAKLDNLQASIRQLMAAQAEDVQQQENRTPRVGTAEAAGAPALTPSQAAHQKLLGNMLHEVAQLRRTKSIHEPDVGIELFNPMSVRSSNELPPAASLPHPNPSTTSASQRSSQIYNFESAHAQPPAVAAPSPTPMPSASQQIGLRPTARARPEYSPEQQAEIDKLSDWLRLVETEEVGAEIVKIQQEAALVAQAERALAEQAQALRDEQEIKKIEEAIPEDHPLLHDTILASPRPGMPAAAVRKRSIIMTSPISSPTAARPAMPLPSPSPTAAAASTAAVVAAPAAISVPPPLSAPIDPVSSPVAASPGAFEPPAASANSGLTIEIMSPASMPLTKPLFVGNNLIAPPTAPLATLNRVPSNVSANARAPVLVPAPLADPMPPAQSLEEKAEALLSLSPNSRVRALEAEKSKIKLRAVITARTSAAGESEKQALYAPFPSMPFLPSLYNHSPEELREAYDSVYTWCDTAMRTEANAQELLTYAVQMDCTGELYAEVAARMDELAKEYVPGPDYHAARARIAAMEEENKIHEQEEYLRQLHEARWQQARVDAFERQWIGLQHREEDREYYLRLDEQMKHDQREQDFAKYLENLANIERKLEAMKVAERGHHLPPQTGTREQQPVSGPALIPVHQQRQVISATAAAIAASPTANTAQTPSAAAAAASAASPVAAAPTSPTRSAAKPRQFRSPHEPAASVVQRPPSAALRSVSDDEDEEEDDEIDSRRARPQSGALSNRSAEGIKPALTERKEDIPTIAQQPSRSLQHDSDDDIEDDDEDHNAAARQAIRAASTRPTSAMAPAASNQFSRPGSRTNNNTASFNRTPDKPLAAQQPITTGRPGTSGGGSVRSGGTGGFTRPKTSSGAALRSRFGAHDSFEEEDEDDDEAAPPLGEDSDPSASRAPSAAAAAAPTPIPSSASLSRDDGPRTLNPRRAAGLNLGGALGAQTLSSRPATAVTGGASFASAPADNAYDSDVSDVSSIVQLPEGITRPGTSVGSAPAILQPVPTASAVAPAAAAASPSSDSPPPQPPALVSQLSTGSNSGILQGRGRPRNQPLKSTVPVPTPRPEAGEDSLSSLLGGGMMRRPTSSSGRSGLNSGPGGFRSKLQSAALRNDSDNE